MCKNNYLLTFLILLVLGGWAQAQSPALDFDGTDDFVQTPLFGVTGAGDRTVSAWVKTTANCNPSQGGRQQTILDQGTFTNGARFTFCLLWSNSVRLEVGGNGVSGTTPVNDGNWHHVAAVYTGSNNQVTLYVDGVQDAQGILTVNANTGQLNPVMIGKRIDDVNYFTGSIDEVRYYSYARTASEIAADFAGEYCTPLTGLAGYWKFNEGIPNGANSSNITATDYVANNDGALSGFALSGSTSNWVSGALAERNVTYGSINPTACQSYTSPSGNNIWTTSGTYLDTIPNAAGCDSIVTVQLTLGATFSATQASACDSYSYGGQLLTQSGAYVDTLTSTQGCDSIITLNLTINNSITEVDTLSGCDSVWYSGNWYLTTQDVMYNGTGANGCDSTVNAHIEVTTLSDSIYVDNGAAYALYTSATTYTWIDCATQQPVAGADSAVFIPAQSGDYALVIGQNGCSDTSACVTIVATHTQKLAPRVDFSIAPNPTSGQFTVQMSPDAGIVQYTIFNAQGQQVAQAAIYTAQQAVRTDLAAGLYFFQVQTATGATATQRLVIY